MPQTVEENRANDRAPLHNNEIRLRTGGGNRHTRAQSALQVASAACCGISRFPLLVGLVPSSYLGGRLRLSTTRYAPHPSTPTVGPPSSILLVAFSSTFYHYPVHHAGCAALPTELGLILVPPCFEPSGCFKELCLPLPCLFSSRNTQRGSTPTTTRECSTLRRIETP